MPGLPAEVDLGSEFRYRDLTLDGETLVVALSQSGETADTLGAVRAARERGAPVLAITNVVGSALAREATGVLYTHAGPEIGVASTKTFLATLTAVYLLGVALGRARGHLTAVDARKRLDELLEMPELVEATLAWSRRSGSSRKVSCEPRAFSTSGEVSTIPIALEGALKLKELSYSHAEGYAGGEMKHGPIALLAEGYPVVALVPRDQSYDRMLANIEEARARGGRVIAVCHQGDAEVARHADPCGARARRRRPPDPAPQHDPAPAPRLSPGDAPGPRRRSASEPGEVGHRGVGSRQSASGSSWPFSGSRPTTGTSSAPTSRGITRLGDRRPPPPGCPGGQSQGQAEPPHRRGRILPPDVLPDRRLAHREAARLGARVPLTSGLGR